MPGLDLVLPSDAHCILFSPSLSPKVHLLGSFILVLSSCVAVLYLFPGAVVHKFILSVLEARV